MESRDKIFDKLRKLMNLKESAIAIGNIGEANAAAAGISRLLMLYNLSEEDIPERERLENPVISEEIPYKFKESSGIWYQQLIATVCEFNLCRSLCISTYKSSIGRMSRVKMQIVGRKKSVEVALYLISFLANSFVNSAKLRYIEYRKSGNTSQTKVSFMKSFLYGCVVGLNIKLKSEKDELNKDGKVTALSVSTTKEISDYLSGVRIEKGVALKPTLRSAEGFHNGVLTGRNVEIHRGIYSSKIEEQKRLEYV